MRPRIALASLAAVSSIIGLTALVAEQPTFREQPLALWRQKLHDPAVSVRQHAAAAFAEMDVALAKAGLSELTEALRDENSRVRFFAARALGQIGPEARAALPQLRKLVSPDGNVSVASAAGTAIAGIDPDFPELADVVRVLIRNDQALGKMSAKSPSLAGEFLQKHPDLAVQHAVLLLDSDDKVLRERAAGSSPPLARQRGNARNRVCSRLPMTTIRASAPLPSTHSTGSPPAPFSRCSRR